MNAEQRKVKAIELMKMLDIYPSYIESFEKDNKVCFFEGYGGYYIDEDSELKEKINKVERKYGCTVYAITHEFCDFGECYSMLLVPKYKEDWDYLVEKDNTDFYAFAYVWNKTNDICSELGTVGVRSRLGGIRRIA